MSTGLKPSIINTYLNAAPGWSRAYHRAVGLVSAVPRALSFYASGADPYSYLVAQMLVRLRDSPMVPDVDILVLPVSFEADQQDTIADDVTAFAVRDCAALACYFEGLDFGSLPEPAGVSMPARLASLADRIIVNTPTLDGVLAVGRALWSETPNHGDDFQVSRTVRLEALGSELGLADGDRTMAATDRNATRQRRGGHYQPGVVRYFGEWFAGPLRVSSIARRIAEEDGASDDGADRVARTADWVPRTVAEVASPAPGEASSNHGSATRVPVGAVQACAPLDVWLSFRSPYSYLAAVRIQRWREAREGVAVRVHPILPMVMRGLSVPKAKRMYLLKDAAREAARLNIPFGRIADPLGLGVERCLAVCAEILSSEEPERLFAFALSALRGIWAEGIDVASDDGIVEVAQRAGIPRDEVWMALTNIAAGRHLAERERQALAEIGLWGVPSFRVGEFNTWGQDRMPLVREALGLPMRHAAGDANLWLRGPAG